MATTTAEPTARKRRRKTRTKNISSLPAILASELTASQIDLTPGKEHAICPTCKNWTPITGVLGTPVLVPHHTTPHHDRTTTTTTTTTTRRCSSSNRRITLDTAVDAWRADLAERTEVSATVASRRPTKVLPKPKMSSAPAPIHRLANRGPHGTPALHRLLPLLERARYAVDQHRAACSLCRTGGRCDAGRALEVRFAETEASCTIAREQLKHQERRQYAAAAPAKRQSEWAAVLPAIQDADTRRADVPVPPARPEAPAQAEAPSVPTEPEHLEAYDRRQAELGRQYARKAPATSVA